LSPLSLTDGISNAERLSKCTQQDVSMHCSDDVLLAAWHASAIAPCSVEIRTSVGRLVVVCMVHTACSVCSVFAAKKSVVFAVSHSFKSPLSESHSLTAVGVVFGDDAIATERFRVDWPRLWCAVPTAAVALLVSS
jgi:hypothetical protein